MAFPAEPPSILTDPSISLLDMLREEPPGEVPALPVKPKPPAFQLPSRRSGVSWSEGGATAPVWLRVRVPRDAPEGRYTGTLTISADGLEPVAVPVSLQVHGYVLPDPRDFATHVGLVHSPDSLAVKYEVAPWSDRHLELMEKTCAFMGELGGSVVFIPLVTGTWLGNRQSLVYWPKDGGDADFSLFDRYLDLIQKHIKPRVVCLYVCHNTRKSAAKGSVSTGAPGGTETMPAPAYAPGDEATAFWKPVIAEANARLKKRGLDGCVTLGLTVEGGGRGGSTQSVVELFKAVWPEGKWADFAHYGAKKGEIHGAPYGYTMSVWGNRTPFRSKLWGSPDIPIVVVKHFRADPIIDLRPIASRGSLYWAAERAMTETQGIGPLGMDFWNFTVEEKKGGRRSGPLEDPIVNLSMHGFSTAAFLGPGPDGPVATARFEIFRQGLQACEARTLIERAVEGGKLGGALAARCAEVLERRNRTYELIRCTERYAQGEGWAWYESSGWNDLTGELFACASEVAEALGK
jgi:hypothetical protein